MENNIKKKMDILEKYKDRLYTPEKLKAQEKHFEEHPEEYFKLYEVIIKECGPLAALVYGAIETTGIYTVKELSDACNLSNHNIRKSIDSLKSKGFLPSNTLDQIEIFEVLMASEKIYTCEWCGYQVPIIEEHHFPIPERDGGKEVVEICPTCHSAFHKIKISINGGLNND